MARETVVPAVDDESGGMTCGARLATRGFPDKDLVGYRLQTVDLGRIRVAEHLR